MYNTNPQVQIHSYTHYCAKVHVCVCVCVGGEGGGERGGGCVCVWVGGEALTVHHIKIYTVPETYNNNNINNMDAIHTWSSSRA